MPRLDDLYAQSARKSRHPSIASASSPTSRGERAGAETQRGGLEGVRKISPFVIGDDQGQGGYDDCYLLAKCCNRSGRAIAATSRGKGVACTRDLSESRI